MPYTHLLFDLDNTILDFDRSESDALQRTFSDFSLPYEQASIDLYHQINKACWLAFENGELDQQTLRGLRFEKFLEAMEVKKDAHRMSEAYLQYLGNTAFWIDGAQQLLDQLRPDFKLVMVTNGLKDVQWPRLRQTKLVDYFETIVISEEIGTSKPSSDFFEFTFDQINHPAKSKTLIIGDSLNSDIRGGNDFGISTCWYNPNQKSNPTTVQPKYEIANLNALGNILKK